ncbi:MAG: SMP-30/gluconolactonase/LRE family protein, partial [Alphaproteobacteria bacterium]|nr:SMP-30/gluconolactonase/LRE family protein [Alphaproteobacteria bacterium]
MDLSRRNLLATAGAITAVAASAKTALARWEPTEKYPDPAVQTLDPAFDKVKPPFQAAVERLMFGCRWAEGPVWMGDHRCVLWSDIPNNRILKWDEETGQTTVYRKPSNYSNGLTRDRQGRLLTCEHDTRRVTRTEYDGTITVIADTFDGKPLNSPNDIVCKSDGSIWFTDPPFGILGNYEGNRATPELPTNVYRVDGKTGQVTVASGEIKNPNGLCFTPDESKMYVVEAGVLPRVIKIFDVVDNGTK